MRPAPPLPPIGAEVSGLDEFPSETPPSPVDESGRQLGGYAGPERRLPTGVPFAGEERRQPGSDVVERVAGKVAAGEPLGTGAAQAALEEKQRVENVREAAGAVAPTPEEPPAAPVELPPVGAEVPAPVARGEMPADTLPAEGEPAIGSQVRTKNGLIGEVRQVVTAGREGGSGIHAQRRRVLLNLTDRKTGETYDQFHDLNTVTPIESEGSKIGVTNAEPTGLGTGELAPSGGAEPDAAEGSRVQGERSRADRRAARKAAREQSRADVARYEQEDLDSLVTHAQDNGYTGDPAELRQQFDSHLQDFKALHADLEDSGHNGTTLLKEIAKGGGISIKRESALKGELRWLKEFRDLQGSRSRKDLHKGPVTAQTIRGVRGVFNEGGLSLDGMREYLSQDARFNHITSINDLLDAIRDAATEATDTSTAMDTLKGWVGSQNWAEPPAETSELAGEEQGEPTFNPEEFESGDVNQFGEEQPRLPEAGSVREQEKATPEFEAPFSLDGGYDTTRKGREQDLFAQDLEDIRKDEPQFERTGRRAPFRAKVKAMDEAIRRAHKGALHK